MFSYNPDERGEKCIVLKCTLLRGGPAVLFMFGCFVAGGARPLGPPVLGRAACTGLESGGRRIHAGSNAVCGWMTIVVSGTTLRRCYQRNSSRGRRRSIVVARGRVANSGNGRHRTAPDIGVGRREQLITRCTCCAHVSCIIPRRLRAVHARIPLDGRRTFGVCTTAITRRAQPLREFVVVCFPSELKSVFVFHRTACSGTMTTKLRPAVATRFTFEPDRPTRARPKRI